MPQFLIALVAAAVLATQATHAALPVPAPPQLGASSYILIDATSGRALAASSPDLPVEPASLTKLMTAYVVFKALEAEQIRLSDEVTISRAAHAAGLAGSRMFAEIDSRVSVENLLRGMIVQSGNDASVALAEHVAGSESVFAGLMNAFAGELGMLSSNFVNSHGLPADNHITSARDMALLARAIITEFPDYYRWYGEREFTWNGITQPNRNGLLARDASVDGMKTGFTDAAGYCLVSSAARDGMRLVSAVMGMSGPRAREEGSQSLLNLWVPLLRNAYRVSGWHHRGDATHLVWRSERNPPRRRQRSCGDAAAWPLGGGRTFSHAAAPARGTARYRAGGGRVAPDARRRGTRPYPPRRARRRTAGRFLQAHGGWHATVV